MLRRTQAEGGFLMIEVVAAMVIVSIALLALMAGYDSAFLSLHKSSQKAVAAQLADQQLELYRALPFAQVILSSDEATAVGDSNQSTYDALYSTNSILDGDWVPDPNDPGNEIQEPSGTVNDVTGTCTSEPGEHLDNCNPIQSVTGSDGRPYRIETFIRDVPNQTAISRDERFVTVIVRDDSSNAGDAEVLREQTAFDSGPS
ncbi:MAG TPA: type II secretion system protein [Gaiellaceae bacterium]